MKLFRILFLMGTLICFSGGITFGSIADDDFPLISGYKIVQDYPVYTPDNLWDYINGAAETYVAFHFRDLQIAEYLNDEGVRIKVEVYRHQSPEYAYGIYCSERYPDYHFVDVGAQGYAEPGLVNFVAGVYYVKVVTNAENKQEEELIRIAGQISVWLVDHSALPKLLTVFPAEGKITKSECFIANNFLGHEFLKDAYIADYQVQDEKFRIFIFYRMNADECIRIVKDYLRFAEQEADNIADGQYAIEDRYNGEVRLVLEGNFIYGFLGCNNESTINTYAGMLRNNLHKIQ